MSDYTLTCSVAGAEPLKMKSPKIGTNDARKEMLASGMPKELLNHDRMESTVHLSERLRTGEMLAFRQLKALWTVASSRREGETEEVRASRADEFLKIVRAQNSSGGAAANYYRQTLKGVLASYGHVENASCALEPQAK